MLFFGYFGGGEKTGGVEKNWKLFFVCKKDRLLRERSEFLRENHKRGAFCFFSYVNIYIYRCSKESFFLLRVKLKQVVFGLVFSGGVLCFDGGGGGVKKVVKSGGI